jgi:hypothetical protein
MPIVTHSPYELLDLTKPVVLPRSHLYHLEPVGVGTAYVESLTGYIARLAESHCLPVRTLILREIVPHSLKVYRSTNLFGTRSLTGALNGTGTMASDLVKLLKCLTRRDDLTYLTLLPWAEILPQRKLLRPIRAWCSACYEEWSATQQLIYEPLIWSVDVVTVCPHHNIYLTFQCPDCHHPLPPLAPYSRPGYCSKCYRWLGISSNCESTGNQAIAKEELTWQTWVVDTVGELLTTAPHILQSLRREKVAQAFSRYVAQESEGNVAAFARRLQIPKNKLWMWQTGKVLPQLQVLLKVCYSLRTSLLDFLTLEAGRKVVYQITPVPQNETVDQATTKDKETFDLDRVQRSLLSVLQGNEKPPPPMTEVAKRIGHDKRIIHRHFPHLCRAISAEYLSYKKQARFKRIEQSCEQVRQAVKKLDSEGMYPTEARVSELLSQPGCFRDKEVRTALKEAKSELGR